MATVGGGGGGGDEDGRNGATAGDDLQGSRSYGDALRVQEMGGERVHVKTTIGIPSLGIQQDCGEDGLEYDEQRVGMAPGGQHAGDHRALANKGMNPTEAGHHYGAAGLQAHI